MFQCFKVDTRNFQVETAAGGHWLDGMVVVPGCDKNMPGVLMARERITSLRSLLYLILSLSWPTESPRSDGLWWND